MTTLLNGCNLSSALDLVTTLAVVVGVIFGLIRLTIRKPYAKRHASPI